MVWQWPKEHGLDNAEHQRVAADPEGERREHDGAETRIAPHHSNREAHIFHDGFKKGQAASVSVPLSRLVDTTQLDERLPASFGFGHAEPAVVIDVHLQVGFQLLIEVAISPIGIDPGDQAR
jgi:hypothetical protein